jgi:hypothetical protein
MPAAHHTVPHDDDHDHDDHDIDDHDLPDWPDELRRHLHEYAGRHGELRDVRECLFRWGNL